MENLLSLQLKKTNKNYQKLFRMNIALVTEYPPVHSGFATYEHYLVDAFRPLNLEIHLLPINKAFAIF